MRILIATGLSSGDVGGPAQYGPKLAKAFQTLGHEAAVISYGQVEKMLPPWVRHLYFLFKILLPTFRADSIIALDTYSVGVPSVLAARLFSKKIIVRVGGDFLWESYVNRTRQKIVLSEFYNSPLKFNLKERVILSFTKFLTRKADVLAFNTLWQKEIWEQAYGPLGERARVVRNYIPSKSLATGFESKVFLWAGRRIEIKNLEKLKKVAQQVKLKHPEFDLVVLDSMPHADLM